MKRKSLRSRGKREGERGKSGEWYIVIKFESSMHRILNRISALTLAIVLRNATQVKKIGKHAKRRSWRHRLAFTPKALNSKAQRCEAHSGLPITHMIEPQRGSTIAAKERKKRKKKEEGKFLEDFDHD